MLKLGIFPPPPAPACAWCQNPHCVKMGGLSDPRIYGTKANIVASLMDIVKGDFFFGSQAEHSDWQAHHWITEIKQLKINVQDPSQVNLNRAVPGQKWRLSGRSSPRYDFLRDSQGMQASAVILLQTKDALCLCRLPLDICTISKGEDWINLWLFPRRLQTHPQYLLVFSATSLWVEFCSQSSS